MIVNSVDLQVHLPNFSLDRLIKIILWLRISEFWSPVVVRLSWFSIFLCGAAFSTHCNTLQHTATHCNTPQHTTTNCDTLQHTATHRNTLQHTATHCNTLQYIFETVVRAETSTSTLDLTHTTTHCNTLQHIATQPTHTATHCNTTQICTQPLYLYLTVRPKLGSQSHTNLSHVLQHCATHCNRP